MAMEMQRQIGNNAIYSIFDEIKLVLIFIL